MRRLIVWSVPLLLAGALAGCGGERESTADTGDGVRVTGAFGSAPKVTIPKAKPGGELEVRSLVTGAGRPLQKGESLVADYVGYVWSATSNKLLGSTYTEGKPAVFAGQLLPGLEQAIVGKPMGSRVLAVIPPALGFGAQGNPQAGVGAADSLVFVVDMHAAYGKTSAAQGSQVSSGGGALPRVTGGAAGQAPEVRIPSGKPPGEFSATTLIQGSGPKVAAQQLVVVQYRGLTWPGGKEFDSSWKRGEPAGFVIGAGQVIKGWDKGIVGQQVGSRLLLVVPPADGYGTEGNPQAGIKGTDTLVFVVDIVGAHGTAGQAGATPAPSPSAS